MGGKITKEVFTSKEALLEMALKSAESIIAWYESEHDRSCYDEEDVPEDLKELEEEFNKVKKRLAE